MKKKIFALLVSSLVLHAEATQGYEEIDTCCPEYCCDAMSVNKGVDFGGFVGPSWVHSSVEPGSVSFDTGFVVGANLGYKWWFGLEFEGEFAYRRNSLDRFTFNDDNFGISGHIRSFSGMGNLKYYLPCLCWYVTPFFGGGIGYADTKLKIDSLNGLTINSNINKNGFAWQVIAGLSWAYRCFDFDAEYRYFRAKGSTWYNSADLSVKYFF